MAVNMRETAGIPALNPSKRILRDISLQWKVAIAILVSFFTCLVVIGVEFDRTLEDAIQIMKADSRKMAQSKTNAELSVARSFYDEVIRSIRFRVEAIAGSADLAYYVSANPDGLGKSLSEWIQPRVDIFTFLCVIDSKQRILCRLRVVNKSRGPKVEVIPVDGDVRVPLTRLFEKAWNQRSKDTTGTIILSPKELRALGLDETARLKIKETPKARPPKAEIETEGLVLGSLVRTVVDKKQYLVFGGQLVNNNFSFVDKLKKVLYGRAKDDGEAECIGTATIFKENLRISTNVRKLDGTRATGTLVSREVEDKVLGEGKNWMDRAFVVNKWYITGYEPIYDVFGKRVGILYVGIPERCYTREQEEIVSHLENKAEWSFIHAIFVGILATIVIALLAGRYLTQPLIELIGCTEALASGRLKVEVNIDGSDEIGRLAGGFRRMASNLHGLATQVREASVNIEGSTSSITKSLQSHASTTAQQSAAVSETTATLEELAASSRQIADNSMQVVRMASKSLESARRAVEVSEETLQKMESIRQANSADIERIRALSNKLQRIDEIMALINTVSDQTKLIAFNAAIEAAGAGEAGKRFGVVSGEIRRLAESVRVQAAEIRGHVSDIQKSASELVTSREQGTVLVQEGVDTTRKVSAALKEIRQDSDTVLTNSKQISMSTQQQRTATEQTLSAVREINEGVNQLADGAEKMEKVVERLSGLATELRGHIDRFEL